MLKLCTCKSEYQDALYGKNRRVHTTGLKNFTCTVCGSKKQRPIKVRR